MNALLASEEGPQVLAVPLDELILGIVAFLIVFAALAKLALPGIRKALEERTAAIEGGIARAEAREAEATAMYEQYQAQLAEARTEAAQIRAQAQADKAAMKEAHSSGSSVRASGGLIGSIFGGPAGGHTRSAVSSRRR